MDRRGDVKYTKGHSIVLREISVKLPLIRAITKYEKIEKRKKKKDGEERNLKFRDSVVFMSAPNSKRKKEKRKRKNKLYTREFFRLTQLYFRRDPKIHFKLGRKLVYKHVR